MSMKVDTNLNLVLYTLMVDNIAENFFSKGEYKPHYGNLNAMRHFYNECVKESKFDEEYPHEIINGFEMADIVADEEFIIAFEQAIFAENGGFGYTFGRAYREALDIVNTKKSSIGNLIEIVSAGINGLVDVVTPAFSEENLAKISDIAKNIANGNLSADAVVDAYAKTTRIDDIAAKVNAKGVKR